MAGSTNRAYTIGLGAPKYRNCLPGCVSSDSAHIVSTARSVCAARRVTAGAIAANTVVIATLLDTSPRQAAGTVLLTTLFGLAFIPVMISLAF